MMNSKANAAQNFTQSGGLVRVSQRGVLALMLGKVALPVAGAWAQTVLSGAQTTTQSPTGSPLVVTTDSTFSVDTTGPSGGGGKGIFLYSTGGISFTDTNQSSITGIVAGINAWGVGADKALTITTTGSVTGQDTIDGNKYTVHGYGIKALNEYGTDVTISVASVTGESKGINARGQGNSGALTITATGAVIGTNGLGIDAYNTGTDLTITANTVSGGIGAGSKGSGVLSITATGEVTGGIYGTNNYGTNLTINTAKVFGGVGARQKGTGALVITASGDISSQFDDGIKAYNKCTDLTISATSVSAYRNGIYAEHFGSGALEITTTGAVSGGIGYDGIFASGYGTDMTISTASVSGGSLGINARSYGTGALTITATGDVIGTKAIGIFAYGYGTDLTISAASVSGGSKGIYANNYGTGALTITATGAVTGTSGNGILAYGYGTDLTITATSVSGGSNGIKATNSGTGALSITTTGTVSGDGYDGIYAYNKGTGLSISAHAVAGKNYGIDAKNTGTGPLAITVSGAVTGVSYGIRSRSAAGGAVTIDLLSTSSVAATLAIVDDAGDAVVSIASGALVTGAVMLGAGDDTLTMASGASLSGVTYLSGGDGTDTLNITSGWSSALDSWDVINADTSGGDFALNGFTLGDRSFGKTGAGTLTLNGAMTLAAESTLTMGVPKDWADPLILATGAATIAGDLVVTPGQTLTFGQEYTLIEASALTGTFGDVSVSGGYKTTLTYTDTSVLLRFDPASLLALGGDSLSPNARALAAAFDAAVDGGFDPQVFADLYTQADTLNAKLRELSGELHSAERRAALDDTRVVRDAALDRLGGGLTRGAGGTFWAQGLGSWGTADADGTGAKITTQQSGVLMGVDFAQGDITYGGMFSYTNSGVDLASLGHSDVTSTGAAAYAGYRHAGSGLAFGMGGALASTSAKGQRSISITGLEQTLTSSAQGTSYQVFGEVSNHLATAVHVQIEPFARLAYAKVDSDAFAETGGSAALSGAAQSNDLRMATFGLRGAYVAGSTTLSGSAAWQHSAGDLSAPTTLSMAGVDTPYEVNSAALDQNAIELAAQASIQLSSGAVLAGGYSGMIGKTNSTHGLRVTLSMAW